MANGSMIYLLCHTLCNQARYERGGSDAYTWIMYKNEPEM